MLPFVHWLGGQASGGQVWMGVAASLLQGCVILVSHLTSLSLSCSQL